MQQDATPVVLSPQAEARFWAKVDRSGGSDACWPWIGATAHGYGQFHVAAGSPNQRAHRVSLALSGRAIPAGMCVCHSCDNPPCCNPDHLWLGTVMDNTQDAARKGRLATGERNSSLRHPERLNPARGESSGRAKLTEADILAIRHAFAVDGVAKAEIGRKYGVTQPNIHAIVRGRTWAHVGGPREEAKKATVHEFLG